MDHRLTIVQAGTGYGKTTALAALAMDVPACFWYTVEEADRDPQRFLSYLIAAFQQRITGFSELPMAILQERGSDTNSAALLQALDALLNAIGDALTTSALLIIDDYHFVSEIAEINGLLERLITYSPVNLRVAIASRYPVELPGLLRWRVRDEVLEVDRRTLAFDREEIQLLFSETYGIRLSTEELAALAEKTEGWPIALQLVWQGLRSGRSRDASQLLNQVPATLAALFDYLASDLFASQSPELTDFLVQTAVLRELTPEACDAVRGGNGSAAFLEYLHERDLFLVSLGPEQYRYHHLFHDFLYQQSLFDPSGVSERHQRAARYFTGCLNFEEAIYHRLAARDFEGAASNIEEVGEAILRAGQPGTVAQWIDALPPEILATHPRLQAYLGDIYRLRSRFAEALAWYQQAEQRWRALGDIAGISRALRGKALVYLDTVRPAQAESLLEEALRLTDGIEDRQARARLLELLAENKLNLGKPIEAELLREQAQLLREAGPAEDVLSVRVKLRTGRLEDAQRILEGWVEQERWDSAHGSSHPPRAHRETVLILSLIHACRGEAEKAYATAQEGVRLGEQLGSPFITAVAQMRLGHACQLEQTDVLSVDRQGMEKAITCYHNAIALGDQLEVRRTRLEALWGLTRAHGYAGDLEAARRTAAEGVEIGKLAGDQWVVALVELALGASYVLASRPQEGIELLLEVMGAFRECGDNFGRSAARLWLSMAFLEDRQYERFTTCVEELLSLSEAQGYDCLFLTPSLLGPPDRHRVVPLLLEARRAGIHLGYVNRLLALMGLQGIEAHPGYQLRVKTLGAFRVWRGHVEIEPRDWQRDKARQLFQFLLTHRGKWLQREEIVERLWPSLAPDAAVRDFKVALNAVNRALEPSRMADSPFAFIVRDGTAYRIPVEVDMWVDAAEFRQVGEYVLKLPDDRITDDLMKRLGAVLQLYEGSYLPEAMYEDWVRDARDQLQMLYLQLAERYARFLLERAEFAECIQVCHQIIEREPCCEVAYRFQMEAFLRSGQRSMALRAYKRCVAVLHEDLGMPPSVETENIYRVVLDVV